MMNRKRPAPLKNIQRDTYHLEFEEMANSELDNQIVQSVIEPYLKELFDDLILREIEQGHKQIGKLVFNEVTSLR
jgi:hypothetical protein